MAKVSHDKGTENSIDDEVIESKNYHEEVKCS